MWVRNIIQFKNVERLVENILNIYEHCFCSILSAFTFQLKVLKVGFFLLAIKSGEMVDVCDCDKLKRMC